MNTSLVDVDVQPDYVRVTIKGKILQLVLPCEVSTDKSLAQRNVTTGNLLVTMPRITKLTSLSVPTDTKKAKEKKCTTSIRATPEVTKREYLEIGPPKEDFDEFLKVVGKESAKETKKMIVEDSFVDDPNVPPLE